MEGILSFIGEGTLNSFLNFYNSGFFSVIKFLIGIYLAVVFLDIILLVYNRGVSGNLQATLFGTALPANLVTKSGKKKIRERWGKIEEMLESNNESQYKVAIIEAENFVEELMKKIGYKGENVKEMLENSPEFDIEGKGEILEAHNMRNKIIHEENFEISKKEAEELLTKYKLFLEYYSIF